MTTDGHGTFNDSNYKTVDAVMSASSWTHIVLTVSGAHGSMPVGGSAGNTSAGKGGGPTVKIYVNGESKDLYFPGSSCHAYWPTSSTDYSNFRGFGTDFTYPVMFFGKINTISGFEFEGDVDEMSLHSTALTADEVSTLYNSGAPQNLTQSGIAGSSSLLSWWRMGDHPDDDMTGEDAAVTSPFSASNGNIIIDVKNAANLHFTAQRHTPADNSLLKVSTGSTSLTGQPPLTRMVEVITSYASKELYDNFNVSRPIPQNDRQYMWLTRSVLDVGDDKYVGYQTTNVGVARMSMYRTSAAGLEEYWTFVSSSEAELTASGGDDPRLWQPVGRLNVLVADSVDDDAGLMGPTDGIIQNTVELIGSSPIATQKVPNLNRLLAHRGSKYGWGWNKFHQNDHPLLRKQRKENELVIRTSSSDHLTKFNLPPVSMKGRPMRVNIRKTLANLTGSSQTMVADATFKVASTNELIFFNQRDLNQVLNIDLTNVYRSAEPLLNQCKVIGAGRSPLNWVLYTQNVFPSMRNEFISGTERTGYDNRFWRDIQGDSANWKGTRVELATGSVRRQSFGYLMSQSAWPLDPCVSFLTRSTADKVGVDQNRIRRNDNAGELQNTYNRHFYSTPNHMRPGALYARAHTIGTARSVASPQGPTIPETGSKPRYSASFVYSERIECFGAGEALWEAGNQAGILRSQVSSDTSQTAKDGIQFVSASSQPWWNNYDSFQEDLKLKAKGFAVVPEFRIHDQIEAYMQRGVRTDRIQGAMNSSGTFSIPGTDFSSTETYPNFYKDYSNTDFVQGFLGLKNKVNLKGAQIRLRVTGAIRLNPYKGFYPAQRTLDLVSQFSSSFMRSMVISQSYTGSGGDIAEQNFFLYGKYGHDTSTAGDRPRFYKGSGFLKQITDPMFSPGILYNSIKSGIAVDYPVVHDGTKIKLAHYGDEGNVSNNWALTITGSVDENTNSGTSAFPIGSGSAGYRGGMFWDRRIPFEAIIRPKSFLPGYAFQNMEAHPSMSMVHPANAKGTGVAYEATCSMTDTGDDVYNLMARNFFGEVPKFFLKDSEMTTLESNTVTNDLQFSKGEVYMTRIKLRRSHNGARTYQYEVDSFMKQPGGRGGDIGTGIVGIVGLNSGYGNYGCRAFLSASSSDPTVRINEAGTPILLQEEFPIPQDPKRNPEFRETFTMYSRPSAFGPPVAGRPTGSWATRMITVSGSDNEPQHGLYTASFEKAAFDSFEGYNPAFTPPYTNGEAWVDLIFRPTASVAYDLERILAETTAVCWRFDAGPPIRRSGSSDFMSKLPVPGVPLLIPVQQLEYTNAGVINENSPQSDNTIPSPYDGLRINVNSMQVTSSLDIFGVERVFETEQTIQGLRLTNKTVGQKWLIRPKWETPMLNFANEESPHRISAADGTLTNPAWASEAVPRGMWHQFGVMPSRPDVGVFMEIGEIPLQWLKNHYMVINTGSIYNNYNHRNGRKVARKVKSLAKLCGFNKNNNQKRLGEIKESQTIHEAIVAVPYITEEIPRKSIKKDYPNGDESKGTNRQPEKSKKFISIPRRSWDALYRNRDATSVSDSVKRVRNALEKYVFPPEFDCWNNRRVDPVAMYVMEFKYEFDQDDLSYIWQNIAPRNYKKLQFQSATVSHNLGNNELISDEILSHPNLRWMVFKVKQRATSDYYDLLVDQAGEATRQVINKKKKRWKYPVKFNWPYDYLSFVELIKMDVDILLK